MPGDGGTPIVADDDGGGRMKRVEEAHHVADQVEDRVLVDGVRPVALALAAHVRCHGVESGRGERPELVAPGVRRLGKAVALEHKGPWPCSAMLRLMPLVSTMRCVGSLMALPFCVAWARALEPMTGKPNRKANGNAAIGGETSRAAVREIMIRARSAGLVGGNPALMAEQFAGLLWRNLLLGLLLRVAKRPTPRRSRGEPATRRRLSCRSIRNRTPEPVTGCRADEQTGRRGGRGWAAFASRPGCVLHWRAERAARLDRGDKPRDDMRGVVRTGRGGARGWAAGRGGGASRWALLGRGAGAGSPCRGGGR